MCETTFGTNSFEYRSIDYLPNILSDERVCIAAIIFDPPDRDGRRCILKVAPDWRQRVRDHDENADLEMLDCLLRDLRTKLLADPIEMMAQLEDSLSNTIQLSEVRNAQVDLRPSNIADFAAPKLPEENAIALTAVDSKRPLVTGPSSSKERVGA
jgi:hypothetical protein